jgi:hypothetical protein
VGSNEQGTTGQYQITAYYVTSGLSPKVNCSLHNFDHILQHPNSKSTRNMSQNKKSTGYRAIIAPMFSPSSHRAFVAKMTDTRPYQTPVAKITGTGSYRVPTANMTGATDLSSPEARGTKAPEAKMY